jgi:hypothetical protein
MMIGEIGFETLFPDPPLETKGDVNEDGTKSFCQSTSRDTPTAVHFLYAFFIFTVTIALANLLIGLAASDIKVRTYLYRYPIQF